LTKPVVETEVKAFNFWTDTGHLISVVGCACFGVGKMEGVGQDNRFAATVHTDKFLNASHVICCANLYVCWGQRRKFRGSTPSMGPLELLRCFLPRPFIFVYPFYSYESGAHTRGEGEVLQG